MADVGFEIYSADKVPYITTEDLLPQLLFLKEVEADETGSIRLPQLASRKAAAFCYTKYAYGLTTARPHKVWRNGNVVHWKHSLSTVPAFVMVMAHT